MGSRLLQTLSAQLTGEYGRGFGRRNLFRMIQFAEVFPHEQIVSALSAQLGWSHFVEIIPLDDPLKRDFYAEMCRIERWSVRTLRKKIDGMLFERTALIEEAGQADPPGTRRPARGGQAHAGPGLPRPLPARVPGASRHLCRERPGGRDPPRNGGVHPRTGRRLRVSRTAEADHGRRRGLSTSTFSSTIAHFDGSWRST